MGITINPRHTSRARPAVLRIVATLAVAGLLGGTPLLLIGIGAFPSLMAMETLLTHPGQLTQLLEHRFSDKATTYLIWSVAWGAWAWFVVCFGVDIVGRSRGRPPRKVPGSRHVQALVTWLMGASLALGLPSRQISPLRLRVAVATVPSAMNRPVTGTLDDLEASQGSITLGGNSPRLISASAAPAQPSPRIYVVMPRDTLWSIAETELGSPMAWRQIAAANYGRLQPDGQHLVDDHWIRPGWRLVIPPLQSLAVGVSGATPSALLAPVAKAIPPIANDALTIDPPVVTGTTEAAGLNLPVSPNALPNRAPLLSTGIRDVESRHGPSGPHIPVAPIGYGILGAGIVGLLDRMRRAQQRNRGVGLRIALPEDDLVELERGLRIAADPGSAEWIDLSLRLLSVSLRREDLEAPAVSAVVLRDDAVEIVLDPTRSLPPPPSPFEFGSTGQSWTLVKSGRCLAQLREDSEVVGIDAPLPSLVTLGREGGGILMVNIESAGSVAVSGTETDPLIQAMAVELATTQWTDQIDLVLVGFRHEIQGLERISHVDSLASVGVKMQRRVQERGALLAAAHRATNSDSRWRDGGDAWDLTIVVCSPEVSRDESAALDDLIEVAGDGSLGVAVVCGCDVPSARWRVRANQGRVVVDGWSLARSWLESQTIPSDFVESVTELISVAGQTSGVTPDDGPYGKLTLPIPEREDQPLDSVLQTDTTSNIFAVPNPQPDPSQVRVRVLGPVEITGAAREFTRAWAIELIVYLAVHPGGVSNEQWATALWPEKAMAPASLHSTASAARRSLGTATSGEDHLPRARGRLSLGPHVKTDWDRFVTLSRSPRPDDWRMALRLVSGRPFDGLRSPDWVVLEGILATVEAGIVDLACRYAQHCLAEVDAPGAEWSARQGLRVSPYDERLYRILMLAADVAGNPAGVESIMSELVQLVAEDVEPFDAVHPETLALYRRLSRRSFASRSRG